MSAGLQLLLISGIVIALLLWQPLSLRGSKIRGRGLIVAWVSGIEHNPETNRPYHHTNYLSLERAEQLF
jgi:hypothetical protein